MAEDIHPRRLRSPPPMNSGRNATVATKAKFHTGVRKSSSEDIREKDHHKLLQIADGSLNAHSDSPKTQGQSQP